MSVYSLETISICSSLLRHENAVPSVAPGENQLDEPVPDLRCERPAQTRPPTDIVDISESENSPSDTEPIFIPEPTTR